MFSSLARDARGPLPLSPGEARHGTPLYHLPVADSKDPQEPHEERVNRAFDALHEELKGYKDSVRTCPASFEHLKGFLERLEKPESVGH